MPDRGTASTPRWRVKIDGGSLGVEDASEHDARIEAFQALAEDLSLLRVERVPDESELPTVDEIQERQAAAFFERDELGQRSPFEKMEKVRPIVGCRREIVFVAVDKEGKPRPSKKWEPHTDHEIALEKYAKRLMELRKGIEDEMKPFLENYF